MATVSISKGYSAIVDDNILGLLQKYKWTYSGSRNSAYAYRKIGTKTTYMHHYIIGYPLDARVVDHVNGNGLDNRRSNLRFVSFRQNCMNAKIHRAGKLGGAFRDKKNGRWYTRIQVNGKRKCIGGFATEEEAHRAYLKRAFSPISNIAVKIPI